MSTCKHCGAEQTGTGWGEDLYACGGASGHPAEVRASECLRRENRQIAADRDRLRAELDEARRELGSVSRIVAEGPTNTELAGMSDRAACRCWDCGFHDAERFYKGKIRAALSRMEDKP